MQRERLAAFVAGLAACCSLFGPSELDNCRVQAENQVYNISFMKHKDVL